MFSFHKPKIYRSNLGCCICKAKSSSSRFTDSKKYENEFERCFRIEEKRSGEICNACVLLVKRWKKLSPENRLTKHWHHVVDARAGPGTKLTGTRRPVGPSSSSSGHHDASTGCSSDDNSSGCHHHQRQHNLPSKYRQDGVLPLSSNQASNQAAQSNHHQSSTSNSSAGCSSSNSNSNSIRGVGRGSSFSSNKARAIDTNVSTFTFGLDPGRRSYMATDPSYSSPSSSSYLSSISGSSSSFSKPQSALNSSAFESVIKRYRQRQQQQQLETQRRQLSRQQRLQQQQLPAEQNRTPSSSRVAIKRQLSNAQQSCGDNESTSASKDTSIHRQQQEERQPQVVVASKRLKRPSESIGSISVDGLRVSALLDNSIWRKEKICCGIIFRGVYNEVAVFPKLLKPCQCRASKTDMQREEGESAPGAEVSGGSGGDQELESNLPAPPPRVTKSGSISSCDSNTSGTGSMEQPTEESAVRVEQQPTSKSRAQIRQEQRRRSGLRSLNCVVSKKEEQNDNSTSRAAGDDGGQLVTKTASKKKVAAGRPRSGVRSRTNKLPAVIDTDSNISSSSSVFSSATGTTASNSSIRSIKGSSSSSSSSSDGSGDGASDSGVAGQLAPSPANSSASSNSSVGSSSRRLLLIADDEELMLDDKDADLDQDDEDEGEVESNTDASSSVESLTGVQRKKSNASAVGAIG